MEGVRRPLAVRLLLLPLLLLAGCGGQTTPDNLVVISLDTTRADNLPTYGYARPTAPRIDALANRSVVFTNAFAQETNTNPSHASMFTGLYPHQHGSLDNGFRLVSEHPTLAEHLRDAGLRCGAFVSARTMQGTTGLGRGFEIWDDMVGNATRRQGNETITRALAWLRTLPQQKPFFLFVHLYDAHGPYRAPEGYRDLFNSSSPGPKLRRIPKYQRRLDSNGELILSLNPYLDQYDASIRYMDDAVGRLLEALPLERTGVVLLADHGESLAERYWGLAHGGQVFDEQIRIPMMLYAPGASAGRRDEMVETVDLLPTALDLLGIPAPWADRLPGRSILPLLDGDSSWDRSEVYAASRAAPVRHEDRGYKLDRTRRIKTVRTKRWKLIHYPGHGTEYLELYDLENDPGETRNLAEREPGRSRELWFRLQRWGSAAAPPQTPTLDDAERERLRSLGYVDD